MSQNQQQVSYGSGGVRHKRSTAAYRYEHMLNPTGNLLPIKIDVHAPWGGLDEYKEQGFLVLAEHLSDRDDAPAINVTQFDDSGNTIVDQTSRKTPKPPLLKQLRVKREFYDEMTGRQRKHAQFLAQRKLAMPSSRSAMEKQVAAEAAAQAAMELRDAVLPAAQSVGTVEPPAPPTLDQRGGKGK